MFERAIELREDIKIFLEEDGMQFNNKVIDMMVDEFGERLESEEISRKRNIQRESKTYQRILVQAIKDVCKRIRNIDFQESSYDIIEDDYSEESDAEYKFRRNK